MQNSPQPLPSLDKTVLRTTAAITVQALKKFIVKKLKLQLKPKQVYILFHFFKLFSCNIYHYLKLNLKFGDTCLGPEHTLHYILKTIAFDQDVPEFHYSKKNEL